MDYKQAESMLTGRCKLHRKLANNTYLIRVDEKTIAVRLHKTNIVTLTKSGKIILNSGKWRTNTTRDRMGLVLPNGYGISQQKGEWFVYNWKDQTTIPYKDEMYLYRGKWYGIPTTRQTNKREKLKKEIIKYVDTYLDKLFKCELPLPDSGDCWMCRFGIPDDGEHLRSHIKEKYYVPSLMTLIMNDSWAPLSLWNKEVISAHLFHQAKGKGYTPDWGHKQIRKAMLKYFGKKLGYSF